MLEENPASNESVVDVYLCLWLGVLWIKIDVLVGHSFRGK